MENMTEEEKKQMILKIVVSLGVLLLITIIGIVLVVNN